MMHASRKQESKEGRDRGGTPLIHHLHLLAPFSTCSRNRRTARGCEDHDKFLWRAHDPCLFMEYTF
jgi:hypothetical protein